MDRGHIDLSGAVGQPHITRLGLGPGLHQAGNGRKGRIFWQGLGTNDQSAVQIEGSGDDPCPRSGGNRRGFSGQERQVEQGGAALDHPVDGHPVSGGDSQAVPDLHITQGH